MTYLELLQLLLPHGVYTEDAASLHAKDLAVAAASLDRGQANADYLAEDEIYPDKTDVLLAEWERVYGLNQTDKPRFQRLQNLAAAVSAQGGLSPAHIRAALKPFVGYDVVVEDYGLLRADDPESLTDSMSFAFDEDYVYQFAVKIDNALIFTSGYSAAAIQAVIDKCKPAHTRGVLDTGVYGFFCDDPNSLTELTLLAI